MHLQIKGAALGMKELICKLIGHKVVNKKGNWHSYCLRCGKDKVWGMD